MVQVHWCVTGFCSPDMVAILTFCLQVQRVLYCLSSGILVCAHLHPYPCICICIPLGARMVQVCTCLTGLLRLILAAILAFAFGVLMWEFPWFAGAVCTALVCDHMYIQVL